MGYLEEIKARGREANPFFGLMGIDPVSYGDGRAELSMTVRPEMQNGAGWLQGGVYTALADEAMALAIITLLQEDERIATISETTSFFAGVRDGTLRARGEVVRKGRRIAFAEAEVSDPEGRVLARTTASFAVMGPRGRAD
ncbi:PaaI family thioesterase [Methanofollis aquaemaris]|uniref:PaaI family thioesterase n=1 Tax=Methanofollis aquaemaris TaxID=126734 RepID=A0A8A3S3H0_9EURY|nr:PaaI family thioesterase [Methanofollis aquaemaris]QSZ66602.1 PaaI family thioesterase [Methanofollis aquaemaris]